jgi:AraC family transcriptional regulator of adaptative response / DNA-3-methyladenine glycosylase II
METDAGRERLYALIVVRDAAWDGLFLTCVKTTGIYCLPSCKAKKPLLRNVVFLSSEPEAQARGFRTCHVCRPDLFYKGESWDENLYLGLKARAERSIGNIRDVPALADLCGVGTSKLGDLFRQHGHCTPAEFLRRTRVGEACRLLLDLSGDTTN